MKKGRDVGGGRVQQFRDGIWLATRLRMCTTRGVLDILHNSLNPVPCTLNSHNQ